MPKKTEDAKILYTQIKLPPSEGERLRRIAERKLISPTAYVRMAVLAALDRDEQIFRDQQESIRGTHN